ncbi:ABC transporter ATP-binding protein [bacterium]|nr:MAG: ABC transporter ATP-binding protein [bacterium]
MWHSDAGKSGDCGADGDRGTGREARSVQGRAVAPTIGDVLTVEGLGKRYGTRWIFRNVAFELEKGERLVITGRNGAGKSTLLRCLAGLIPQSEGKVTLPGDPRTTLGVSALDQALYGDLTASEHLVLSGDLRGVAPRAEELLAKVDLPDVLVREMSTGMRARLRMALAVQADPAVLLLDEPGASLDEHGRTLVTEIAAEQAERGCLVVATNDPAERRLADLELELAS